MNTNRRLDLLKEFAQAGDDGITMNEGVFTSVEISKLEELVARTSGAAGIGVYRLTEQGKKYLEVMRSPAVSETAIAA